MTTLDKYLDPCFHGFDICTSCHCDSINDEASEFVIIARVDGPTQATTLEELTKLREYARYLLSIPEA